MNEFEYLIGIGTLVAVGVSVLSYVNSRKKDQSVTDNKQNEEIAKLTERMNSISDRMNRIDARQDVHETKTELAIKELSQKIEDIPEKIVALILKSKEV